MADPKITDLLGILTAILTVAIVVMAVLYWPTLSTRTTEIRDSADLQSCRAQANAAVTEARTEFDVARATRDTAATHLTVLTNEGLVAGVTGDDVTFERILGSLNDARAEVTQAETIVVDATEHLREVSANYKAQVIKSREDPKRFLAECRAAG